MQQLKRRIEVYLIGRDMYRMVQKNRGQCIFLLVSSKRLTTFLADLSSSLCRIL